MNINYKLQGVKPIKKLSVRFYHHKFDLSTVTNIMLMESEWDSMNQSVIDNSEVTIALQDLKSAILKQYNRDFCNGVLIDKVWLQKVVKTSFGRPKEEENLVSPDHTIYVSDFSTWWLDTQAVEWSVSAKKKMDVPLQNQYKKFVKTLQEYEKVIGEKLQLRSIKIKDLKSFVDYLDSENYQTSTIERQTGRFRFFLNRASEHNIEVNQSFKQRIYFDKDEDIEGVYLNEKEISKIYNLDLSHDEDLDNVRDNLIISVWTALRISDFMYNLNTENIKDGIISIKTNKTGSFVKIPVHYQVKSILFKRFGNLPKKISSSEYNIKVKKVCQLAEIDYLVYGKLFDNKLKRKAVNYYKKYELISSHVGRKSLISNLRGKVSNETLMAIGGWKSEKMINHYTKTSKTEYARLLENFWENN